MRIKQISIFLENKPGRLADVTGILAESGINIRGPVRGRYHGFRGAAPHCG